MGGRASCVSQVGASWALQRSHKTLRTNAQKEREREKRGRQRVNASRK